MSPRARRTLRWTGAALAVLVGGTLAAGRHVLVPMDQLLGGRLGVVLPGDFWRADTGPSLLGDAAMTARLRARVLTDDLYRERDLLSLLFLSRLRQGQSRKTVLADPSARAELLGTVLAEGAPPAWWRDPASVRASLAVTPRGSFQLGLLSPEEGALVVSAVAAQPGGLGLGEARAVLQAVSLHPGLLPPAEVDRVLAAWVKSQAQLGWALAPVVEARRALFELTSGLAKGGAVGVRLDASALPSTAAPRAVEAVQRLLRTTGLTVTDGDDLVLTLTVETREYEGMAWSRAAAQHRREKAKFYLGPSAQEQTVTLDRDVVALSSQAVRGRLRVPTLVVQPSVGGLRLEAPPFGFLAPDGSTGGPLLDGTSPAERQRLGLPDELALLLSSWTFGVD